MNLRDSLRLLGLAGTALLVAPALILVPGCEKSTNAEQMTIMFDPPLAMLSGPRQIVVIQAYPSPFPDEKSQDRTTGTVPEAEEDDGDEDDQGILYLPLTWTVSDPTLGTIVSRSGSTAVYESKDKTGNNYITCRDQSGAEGVVAIYQLSAEEYAETMQEEEE